MDRRKFLEASALLGGAMLVKPELAVASSNQKAKLSADLDVKSYVKEPKRLIPVIDTADVVILGGGPAGVSAAVSAARCGADVILLEKQYYLGGLWTGCCVLPVIDTYGCAKDGQWKKCIFGFAQELVTELTQMNMCIQHQEHPTPDPEATKYVLEKYISETGVRLLYNCYAANAIMSGDRIDAIIADCKSGRVALEAKVFLLTVVEMGISWNGQERISKKEMPTLVQCGVMAMPLI